MLNVGIEMSVNVWTDLLALIALLPFGARAWKDWMRRPPGDGG